MEGEIPRCNSASFPWCVVSGRIVPGQLGFPGKIQEACGITVECTRKMWIYCRKYKKNVDLLWKVLEKCGFTVESIRKMWFYCGK